LFQGVDDAVFAGRANVVNGPWQCGRGPQQPAERIGDDLHVHAVLLMLPGVEGPVGGDPVDGQERPVEQDVCLRRSGPDGLLEGRCECGQEIDGLADVAVDGARFDPETRCELGVRGAVPQVCQHRQGLTTGREPAPAALDPTAVFAQASGKEGQGSTGHVQPARVDKHVKPLAGIG
jgi:hypothetical protein